MPLQLVVYAEACGIRIEYWDFVPPIEALYFCTPDTHPVIGLSKNLPGNKTHFRTVLAEEIGHHFTCAQDGLPKTYFHYHERLRVCRAECRALRWAARFLIPDDALWEAMAQGIRETWRLAEHFEVDEGLMKIRLCLEGGVV